VKSYHVSTRWRILFQPSELERESVHGSTEMALYLRQLLAGRDFAKGDDFATQMSNFVYLVGDDEARLCLVVDPAWDIPGILKVVEGDGMILAGALATHYHPDHVGGHIFGYEVAGLTSLIELMPVPIHVNAVEAQGLKQVTGLSDSDLVTHSGGDEIVVGAIQIKSLHTPGHTPGSQCFLAGSSLISGDTLFIGSCGRVDLPGGNAEQLYQSLTQILAKLPAETRLYPGHNYASKPYSTIGDERHSNYCLRVQSLDDWLTLMGRPV
jgi:hydroxyacylglutathione hydrolase